ncbi:MAG: glycosyltransferase [Gammaproteobacteria bacterium]
MNAVAPVLSIAIPTWNRAPFLAGTLEQLRRETTMLPQNSVEILVSDNCSSDATPAVVCAARERGLIVRYVRNDANIGSDGNIAQCFNLAQGRNVLILGDDDLPVDGALGLILGYLNRKEYGVVCWRPYGFERDFRREYPGGHGNDREFDDPGEFLAAIGPLVTLISSCVINKALLTGMDARQFCGGNLVQVHLVIRAAMAAKVSLYLQHYLVACKRNNSGGYEFSQVFVEELGEVLDRYRTVGLSTVAIEAFENRMLLGYYPFYVFRQRLANRQDPCVEYARFRRRFGRRLAFLLFVAPILRLPRPFGLAWGAAATMVGRIATGDLRRGLKFVWRRLVP